MGGLSIKRIKRTITIRNAEQNIPMKTNIFLKRRTLTSKNLSKKHSPGVGLMLGQR
jgi:hypothetical protein